ncbi:MAG: hypothetical protein ABI855_13300 [Bacteroidota bacterium]
MNCNEIFENYINKIIEIEFSEGTFSYNEYGKFIGGILDYPQAGVDNDFFENHEIKKNVMVKLKIKVHAFAKMKYKLSDENEKKLFNDGFFCKDVNKIISISELQK